MKLHFRNMRTIQLVLIFSLLVMMTGRRHKMKKNLKQELHNLLEEVITKLDDIYAGGEEATTTYYKFSHLLNRYFYSESNSNDYKVCKYFHSIFAIIYERAPEFKNFPRKWQEMEAKMQNELAPFEYNEETKSTKQQQPIKLPTSLEYSRILDIEEQEIKNLQDLKELIQNKEKVKTEIQTYLKNHHLDLPKIA